MKPIVVPYIYHVSTAIFRSNEHLNFLPKNVRAVPSNGLILDSNFQSVCFQSSVNR